MTLGRSYSGGEGEIRTHGTRKGSTVFETAAFDHSATSPVKLILTVDDRLLCRSERLLHLFLIFLQLPFVRRFEAHHQHRLRVRCSQQAPALVEDYAHPVDIDGLPATLEPKLGGWGAVNPIIVE